VFDHQPRIQAWGASRQPFIEGNVVQQRRRRQVLTATSRSAPARKRGRGEQHDLLQRRPQALGESVNLGLGGECVQARVTNNYFTGANPLNSAIRAPVEMKANTLHAGRWRPCQALPDNVFMQPKEPPMPTMTG
jgi:hypothetical protein